MPILTATTFHPEKGTRKGGKDNKEKRGKGKKNGRNRRRRVKKMTDGEQND